MLDKIADDLDVDVGFEQREPNLTKRFFDIALSDATLTFESLKNALEAIA